MKKIVLSLLAALGLVSLLPAQELAVESFELLPTDLTAKIADKKDLNGDVSALVKIFVAQPTISVPESMRLGEIETPAPSEFRAFMPAGSRRIQINAAGYLPLRFEFPEPLETMRTYVLRLSLPERAAEPREPELTSNFLALTVSPKDATVLVDNMPRSCHEGMLALELALGNHDFQISAPMYHTRRGEFAITAAGTTELKVDLDPAFGYLKVSSTPSGAGVLVNGEQKGSTPCTVQLGSGSYALQLVKSGYLVHAEEIVVADGRTTAVQTALTVNFARVTLRSPLPSAEIWVSGRKMGTGTWTGDLDAGSYRVESRCEGYESVSDNITVEPAAPRTYALTSPVPIYCVLKVNTVPMGAVVKLDGELLGKTPVATNRVLAGSRTLTVESEGYQTISQTVKLAPDKPAELALEMKVKPKEKMYKVGDYYEKNGKKGVVFEVDALGLHGKIIALTEAAKTDVFNSYYPYPMTWEDAQSYCKKLGPEWRLPTKEELLEIYRQKSLLNAALRNRGKSLEDSWYWSKTEAEDKCAWIVKMNYGYTTKYKKDRTYSVRAVSAF